MTCSLVSLTIAAQDPVRLAGFWAELLGRETAGAPPDGVTVLPADDTAFPLRFTPTAQPKSEPNRMHLDLTSTSMSDQERTVARALELGGRHTDVGQRPEEPHVVLADPEGNEFCVIEPGNAFLAGCGAVGALASDGSRAAGLFWSRALDWPLVWDQDQETAIRSPRGGPKISWGGPPFRPKTAPGRLHLDLAPPARGNTSAEVGRLLDLGARPADVGQGNAPWTVLADPDGNEFCVLPPA